MRLGKAVPWSYSSLQQFETCPRRFYLTRIVKAVKEPQTAATAEGNRVHKVLEDYVKGTGGMSTDLLWLRPFMDRLRAEPGNKVPEQQFGLTRDLRPTGFFDANVWVRGKLDLNIHQTERSYTFDYKTGKRKIDSDQLKLYAGVNFAMSPHAKEVVAGFIWIPDRKIDREVYTRDQMIPIFQEFAGRVHKIEECEQQNDWPAKPSGLCRQWCPVGRANCEHCGS
jgi:CRISPR/Cas system-associated exonuclease Cas4 (RecB family)